MSRASPQRAQARHASERPRSAPCPRCVFAASAAPLVPRPAAKWRTGLPLLKRGDLRIITETRKPSPGRLEAHALFCSLCYGADDEFLAAADTLAKLLIGQIDR